MTTQEFHIGVNLGVQKIASNVNDDFLPQEIDYYLNESVKDYIKQQYSLIKNEDRNLESQVINENLRTLITTTEIDNISVVNYLPHSVEGDLPTNYLYYIFARTKFNDTWKNNRKLEPKGIKQYLETEHNSPIFREFPLMLENDKIIIIGDALNELDGTTEIRFTYIKTPSKFSFNSDPSAEFESLPEHTHKEIVNLTVNKILQIIQPQPQS